MEYVSRLTRGSSELEVALKALHAFLKGHGDPALLKEANAMFELFEQMKKEFRAAKLLWRSHREHIAAMDELHMARTRIR